MTTDRNLIYSYIIDILSIKETPALIQWLVKDKKRLDFAKALVIKIPNTTYQIAKSVCEEHNFNLAYLLQLIGPAITSTGFIEEKTKPGDYYALLKIPSTANNVEIKHAYRNLMRKIHPDVSPPNSDNHDNFAEIAEAYKTLSNPQLRKQYDLSRKNANQWYETTLQTTPPKRKLSKSWLKTGLVFTILIFMLVGSGMWFEAYFYNQALYETKNHSPSLVSKSIQNKMQPLTKRKIPPPPLPSDEMETTLSPPGKPQTHHPKSIEKTRKAESTEHITQKLPSRKEVSPLLSNNSIETTKVRSPVSARAIKPLPFNPLPSNEPAKPAKNITERLTDEGDDPIELIKTLISQEEKTSHQISPIPENERSSSEESGLAALKLMVKENKYDITDNQGQISKDINARIAHLTGSKRKGEIKKFIKEYAATYERRDLQSFRALFHPDSLQNGEPFENVEKKYNDIFTTKRNISYTIQVEKIVFDVFKNTVKVTSSYAITWQSTWSNEEFKGFIVFTLTNRAKEPFKILSLDFETQN